MVRRRSCAVSNHESPAAHPSRRPQAGAPPSDERDCAHAGMRTTHFPYCARNARNESCGLSTSEMTQPSGPFTRIKFSMTARP
jgi:hypothetical protein